MAGEDGKRGRSTSRTRTSRPTTPLRPSSRSSFRESARESVSGDAPFPLNAFEPAFAELSDAMADLEANMMHFQIMHESLARFSESFASFMYGLNMNAFCVDFPEVWASRGSRSGGFAGLGLTQYWFRVPYPSLSREQSSRKSDNMAVSRPRNREFRVRLTLDDLSQNPLDSPRKLSWKARLRSCAQYRPGIS